MGYFYPVYRGRKSTNPIRIPGPFTQMDDRIKYLDTTKITEEQGIKLIVKHFPIAIQAYLEGNTEKHFLSIWEKLDDLEDHQIISGYQSTTKKPNNLDRNQDQNRTYDKDRDQHHNRPYNQEQGKYKNNYNQNKQNNNDKPKGNIQKININSEDEEENNWEKNNE